MKTPPTAASILVASALLPAISQTALHNDSAERRRERFSVINERQEKKALTDLRDSAASLLRTLPPVDAAAVGRLQPAARVIEPAAKTGDLAALKPIPPLSMPGRGDPPEMDVIEGFLESADLADSLDRHSQALDSTCSARLGTVAEFLFGRLELAAARRPAPRLRWRNFALERRGGRWLVRPASGGELRIPWAWRLKSATPQGVVFEKRSSESGADTIQIADAEMGSVSYTDGLGRPIDPDTGYAAFPDKGFLVSLSRQEPLRGWPVD